MKSVMFLSLLVAAQLVAHSTFAKDSEKEIKWLVPSVRTLVQKGDSSFAIFKIEVDVRKSGMDCYDKKDGGLTVHDMVKDQVVPKKISGLKDGVLAAIITLNGMEVCPDQQCSSRTARKSEWAPFENRLELTDLAMLNGYNEMKGICSNPISNVIAEIALQEEVIAKEIHQKGKAQLEIKIAYFKKGSLEHTVLGSTILDLSQLKANRNNIKSSILKSSGSVLGQVQTRPGIAQ